MRKLLLLIALPLLTSCSVMKHKKESHTESTTESTHVSVGSNSTVDTSKTTTNEYWRITVPAKLNAQPKTPEFPPFVMPDLSSATTEQRDALLSLQKQYNDLLSHNNARDASEAQQTGLLIEMIRQTQENAGKSSYTQQQDSTSNKQSEKVDQSEKQKTEQLSAWQIIAITGILVYVIIKIFK